MSRDFPVRKNIRLKNFDYSQRGAYFVTICTQGRVCLFGEVLNDEMELNNLGKMVKKWWFELENKFPHIEIDPFVTMPNHIHGIISIVGADLCVGPSFDGVGPSFDGVGPVNHKQYTNMDIHESTGGRIGPPLPRVMQWFKTMTTNEYLRRAKKDEWPLFDKHLWQRNYYEHMIRNEKDHARICEYIVNNPLQWAFDKENPNKS